MTMDREGENFISRRQVFKPITAVALTGAAVIPAAANANDNPDARLFELKREFDRIATLREQVDIDYADDFAEWDRRLDLARETRDMTLLKGMPRHDHACKLIHDLDGQSDRVMAAMMAHGAKTPAGLAVIAAALKDFDLHSYWNETDGDADWDQLQARRFIDMVIAFGEQAHV